MIFDGQDESELPRQEALCAFVLEGVIIGGAVLLFFLAYALWSGGIK